jgi:hypothetical protein
MAEAIKPEISLAHRIIGLVSMDTIGNPIIGWRGYDCWRIVAIAIATIVIVVISVVIARRAKQNTSP